jgi:hypothetical protein
MSSFDRAISTRNYLSPIGMAALAGGGYKRDIETMLGH